MRTSTLALLIGLTITAASGQDRYVTMVLKPDCRDCRTTNTLIIAEGETAQVVDSQMGYWISPPSGILGSDIQVEKDGALVLCQQFSPAGTYSRNLGTPIVAGPAKLHLVGSVGMITVKIIPTAVNPNQTLIVPPGPGGNVVMECSSNLVNWVTATNGVYADPTTAKFFRIRLESLPIAPAAPK